MAGGNYWQFEVCLDPSADEPSLVRRFVFPARRGETLTIRQTEARLKERGLAGHSALLEFWFDAEDRCRDRWGPGRLAHLGGEEYAWVAANE